MSEIDAAKEYIQSIRDRQITADKEFVLDSLTGAINRLEKAFPRCGSFLMEFIQNADDAGSESLKIEILEDSVRISNDGSLFSEDDVRSICKVGRSAKTPRDYIGYLGVGFKSVFLISECPEIHSGHFRFRFARNSWPEPDHTPWQVIPLWIDNLQIECEEYGTVFNIPLKDMSLLGSLREEIEEEYLSSRILLFLRNVRELRITDLGEGTRREMVKYRLSETPDYEIYQIEEHSNDVRTQQRWLVFRSICTVPEEVRKDYMTREWERDHVDKREVLAAFRLGEKDNLLIEQKGTAHIGVFSFLPLKEVPSGLNFLVQADFLTTPGRGELARECLWNAWLAREIYTLIVEEVVPSFLKNEKWKMNLVEILYSSEGGHELFERYIKTPMRDYLENESVLIAEDGSVAKADELVHVEEEIGGLLGKEELQIAFPGRRVIHKDCFSHLNSQSHRSLYHRIAEAPSDVHRFLYSSHELMEHKAKSRDVEWFKKIYSMFVSKYSRNYFHQYHQYNAEHDKFWSRMRSFHEPIILTDDYGLARIKECYTNPKKLNIPQEISGRLKIVHPELVEHEGFQVFLRRLNEERCLYRAPEEKVIDALSGDDIRDALKRQNAIDMDGERWKTLSDDEKIEQIKHIKELWNSSYVSLEDYAFLTLRDKAGNWTEPKSLILPREYKPGHNIDVLAERDLLDLPIVLVSPEFVDGKDDGEVKQWRGFLQGLGVDQLLESKMENTYRNKIIERIAVLTSLEYEREHNRDPKELGESEQPGYDIESKSENEVRHIEVKGHAESGSIRLTANEFVALKDKLETYFVYVVTDVLVNPSLHIVSGKKLLEIDPTVIIQYWQWRNVIEVDQFQPLATW